MMNEEITDIDRLNYAIEWGFDTSRPAWQRALAKSEEQADSWPAEVLVTARQEILDQGVVLISGWYKKVEAAGGELSEIAAFDGNPEGLWQELYYMNYGVFGLGLDPLDGFMVNVPSLKEGELPLLLSPRKDGWGV